ncbi:hypothetical protein D018_4245B, partial [Vibrio parahaemolyticus VP2007-007]
LRNHVLALPILQGNPKLVPLGLQQRPNQVRCPTMCHPDRTQSV